MISEARQQLQNSAPLIANTSLAAMRENNWKFVEQALKVLRLETLDLADAFSLPGLCLDKWFDRFFCLFMIESFRRLQLRVLHLIAS